MTTYVVELFEGGPLVGPFDSPENAALFIDGAHDTITWLSSPSIRTLVDPAELVP